MAPAAGYGAIALVLALALSCPALAHAHAGNPNFRSEVADSPAGLDAQVLSFDDRIEVEADPGHTVVVLGYEDEPYLRFRPDGTVEVNRRSPATYLNEDRFANVELPPEADAKAQPVWEEVAAHDTYSWHDHRIHYMAEGTPPAVTDESVETKVFDWTLPVTVDDERERIAGTLTWVPTQGGPSLGVLAGLGAAVLASFAFAVWRLRRRARGADEEPPPESEEAW